MTANIQTGIKSFGAYLPARRMSRAAIADAHEWAFPSLQSLGRGERSMCSWDEDVMTMAVEAGRDCLLGANRDGVTAFDLASTTAPYADLQNAATEAFKGKYGAVVVLNPQNGQILALVSEPGFDPTRPVPLRAHL